MEHQRLFRNKKDLWIGGVAGGLSEYFKIDPIIIRMVFIVLALAGGGGVIIYIILWAILPARDDMAINISNQNTGNMTENMDNQTTSVSGEGKKENQSTQRGSLAGGLILITVGILFLINQFVDISFHKLWPVLIIVFGVLVIVTGFYSKKN